MKLIELLKKNLSKKELEKTITSFEIIGEIAVIQVPDELVKKQKLIAEAVMKVNKNIKTVVKRSGEVSGPYRIKTVRHVAGEKTTRTIHKENNCRFMIELNKAYFSPRLQHERELIIKEVKPGEVVIDMFAGAGPFGIGIARNTKAKEVHAIDHNPEAIKLLKENIKLNKVINVKAIQGDSLKVIKELPSADRIIMNAPRQNNKKWLNSALKRLKPKGRVHFYITSDKWRRMSKEGIKVIKERRVIDYAPGKSHVCVEIKKG